MTLPAALLWMLAAQAGADKPPESKRDTDIHGWWAPDYAKLQTGGYAGLLTAGLGYAAFDDVLNVTLLYGYVPEAIAGRTVHSLHLAFVVRPLELSIASFRLIPAYAGVGVLYTWGDGYFVALPERYPAGYYRSTALQLTAHLGAELDLAMEPRSPFERHGLYLELCALEVFVGRYLRNPESIGVTEVVSLAVGYRVAF